MLRNFLKTAIRNLVRQRFYSAINLFGLSIGVAGCITILLWVADEKSYDRWNPKVDRIYRINSDINFGGNHYRLAVAPAPMAPTLRQDFPEVETTLRFRQYGGALVKRDEQNYREDQILFADSTVFQVFPRPILAGDGRRALTRPGTLAISASRAEKYFGSAREAVGGVLIFDNEERWEVTAVFEDFPSNSHVKCHFFKTMLSCREEQENAQIWLSNNFHTYVMLREGADPEAFEKKLDGLLDKYIAPQVKQMTGLDYQEMLRQGSWVIYDMMPVADIHLHSDLQAELEPSGDIQYVYIFSAIALFILLIACINFMNLSTARSARRAREIGVRKVLGSQRGGLALQFLVESTLLSALAFLLGLGLVELAMPWYNQLTGKELFVPYTHPFFVLSILLGIAGVGLLAGSYPAAYLSSLNPLKSIKGAKFSGGGKATLRGALVVFQFIAAVFLITGTLLVYRQLNYIQNKNLGYKKEQVLIVNDTYTLGNQVQTFKEAVLQQPEFISGSVSAFLPVPSARSDSPYTADRVMKQDNTVNMQGWEVDHDYIRTLGMELVAGRDFSREFPSDSSAIILNERAATLFGFKEPIGKKVYAFNVGLEGQQESKEYTIIGIVRDFHFESMRRNIGALSLRLSNSPYSVSFRLRGDESASAVAAVENIWNRMAPGMPFNFQFLDSEFDAVYRAEQRIGSVIMLFALLSIFVSCLGLFGLATYTAERRTREIGIRKVLGATVPGLVGDLSKEFLKLVLIAILVALPLSWWAMHRWLQGFAYRTSLDWWVFALSGVMAIFIAFLTVSYQSIKAARSNPVRALKYE